MATCFLRVTTCGRTAFRRTRGRTRTIHVEEKRRNPEIGIYLAAEKTGDTDRLPTFLALYDQLAFAGLDIKLVGSPKDDE